MEVARTLAQDIKALELAKAKVEANWAAAIATTLELETKIGRLEEDLQLAAIDVADMHPGGEKGLVSSAQQHIINRCSRNTTSGTGQVVGSIVGNGRIGVAEMETNENASLEMEQLRNENKMLKEKITAGQ